MRKNILLIVAFLSSLLAQITNYTFTNWNTIQNTTSMNSTLTNEDQSFWLVDLAIGYPQQYFTVSIDTGSNILWVTYQDCSRCAIQNRYNPDGQSYFNPNGSTYYQAYGSGECSGYVATDLVNIVGTPLNVTNFAMMFATMEQGFGSPFVFDGLMGISNNQSFTNIFQAGYQAGQIPTELYGIVLNQAPLNSYLIFGDIDQQLLDQAIWVTADDIYRWKLFINAFVINGVDYTSSMGRMTSAILDSGTTCFSVSKDLYNILVNNYLVPGGCYLSGSLYCPCNPSVAQIAQLPNITIAFNQVNITIPFYNLLQDYYISTDGDVCLVMLQSISGQSFMIFGDPTFLSIIPLFNKTGNSIGIIGGVANGIPNAEYSGADEIDE